MPSKKGRTIKAEDLYEFQLISGSAVSPDGKWVVYSVDRIDRKREKKYSNLWVVSTGGGKPRQFTQGDQKDTQPAWSPDSQQIAFLSKRADDKHHQVYIIPFFGGEARRLTDLDGEIANISWSPNGKMLGLQLRQLDPEAIEREKDEHKKKLGVVARHIDRVFYKMDGSGYLPHERWHIWMVNVQSGKTHQLTSGPIFDEVAPAWSPDSKKLVYLSNRNPDPDLNWDDMDVFIYDLPSKTEKKVDTHPGMKTVVSFSPDGNWIAWIGQEGRGEEWKINSLWVVPANNSTPYRNLTGKYDIHLNPVTINDMGTPQQMPPAWSADSQKVFFQIQKHGNTNLMSVDLEGEHLRTIFGEQGVVAQFSLDRSTRQVVYLLGEIRDPGQLWVKELHTDQCRKLTSLNQSLLNQIDFGQVEEVWFKGPAGNDLQGWILKPPYFDPSTKYPAILQIHGGPLLQYGNFFMHEFYYLAAHGYVVFFCNPRGGHGYGEEHAKAIYNGRWGTVDYEDLMAWTDYIEKQPYIDSQRLGVTGGSYGGYMTNWIIGHTHRFKAAVTMRSVSNLISMWGSSDFNWQFQETFDNKPPYESIEVLWEESPIKHFGNVRTPTLVIHSEQDLRCPLEQGEQVYVTLKKLGVDTEMVIFPDSSHGLSRDGRTDRRIVRLQHILRWFDKYLKD